jgi:hypothetical protein
MVALAFCKNHDTGLKTGTHIQLSMDNGIAITFSTCFNTKQFAIPRRDSIC